MRTQRIRQGYVREEEAAAFLGLEPATFSDWRYRKKSGAPPCVRFGRAVRYSIPALEAYAAQSTVQPE